MLMTAPVSSTASMSSSQASGLTANRLPLDRLVGESSSAPVSKGQTQDGPPILPSIDDFYSGSYGDDEEDEDGTDGSYGDDMVQHTPTSKKREWLLRMNRRLNEIPVGSLDPSAIPVSAVMNAWAKTKSAQGASMVEMWLKRIQDEANAGNTRVLPNTKMYTMAGKLMAQAFLSRNALPYLTHSIAFSCSLTQWMHGRKAAKGSVLLNEPRRFYRICMTCIKRQGMST